MYKPQVDELKKSIISISAGILFFVFLCICFFSFFYSDIRITVEHSFNFIDAVRKGNFFDFYQIAIDNSNFNQPAVYDFPIYIVFAIWNFPIYVLTHILHIDYLNSVWCLCWMKLMLVFFCCVATYFVGKIVAEIGCNRSEQRFIQVIFVTSTFVIIPIFFCCQYDIISITFALWGILYYLRNKQGLFVLLFAIAFPFKIFSFLVFFPLLLLREKRLQYIILKTVCSVSGAVFSKALFLHDAAYISSTSAFNKDMLARFQVTSISWNFTGVNVSLFLVGFAVICGLAYAKSYDEYILKRMAIYIPFVILCSFIVLIPINPYWMILVAPYFSLLYCVNRENLKINMVLETVLGIVLLFVQSIVYYWVFSYNIMTLLVLPLFVKPNASPMFSSILDMLRKYRLDEFVSIAGAIAVACLILLCYLNYPRRQKEKDNFSEVKQTEVKCLFVVRLIPSLLMAFLLLSILFVKTDVCIYSNVDANRQEVTNDLLEKNATVKQDISFEEAARVSKIAICVDTQNATWICNSIISYKVEDEEGNVIVKGEEATNHIDNGLLEIKMDTRFERNKRYRVVLSAYNKGDTPVYVRYNTESNNFKTTQGGRRVEGDIQMGIYGEWL